MAIISALVARALISSDPLSVDACIASLASPAAGGLGLFVGTVRDADGGRSVQSLAYEAHPTAVDELARVCAAVAEEHDVIAVAAEHRVGTLSIGDVAVVVAVSAVHRAEALATTHALIDRIKAEVPIWKHQRFSDGTDEWVGCS